MPALRRGRKSNRISPYPNESDTVSDRVDAAVDPPVDDNHANSTTRVDVNSDHEDSGPLMLSAPPAATVVAPDGNNRNSNVSVVRRRPVVLHDDDSDDELPALGDPPEEDPEPPDTQETQEADDPTPHTPPRRGRGRPRHNRPPSPPLFENDGLTYDFSLTIASLGQHVPPVWLESLSEFCQAFGQRGSLSLERGGKQENLHIQAVVTFECKNTNDTITRLKKKIKSALNITAGDGTRWYVASCFSLLSYCPFPHVPSLPEPFRERKEWSIKDHPLRSARSLPRLFR